jgi:hypothetical protein
MSKALIKNNNYMNKTVITTTSIISVAFLISFYIYTSSKERVEIQLSTERMAASSMTLSEQTQKDRLTVCIETIMKKSIESGKPIDAEKARSICG